MTAQLSEAARWRRSAFPRRGRTWAREAGGEDERSARATEHEGGGGFLVHGVSWLHLLVVSSWL